ncbi:Transcription initiation factor TFIID subunit 13 [Datura stramonium]|uniref:Transcription initiation factor TFIID subunit 13 n=1 Tax=Datura stramonium TaxID=4076 RepID=A0ABS8Y8B3_DATST|nr:Transcription initiation factor TFIID subunit 13 [Datura stramonium]
MMVDYLINIKIFRPKVILILIFYEFLVLFYPLISTKLLVLHYQPLPETVTLVEDIVVDYVTDMVHKAQDVASKRGKLLTEDFLFLIRKDLPKLNRCTELLSMNEELKQARKAFEVDEEKLATLQ